MTAASEEATMDLGTVILASEKKIAAREDSEGEVEAVLQAEVVVLVEKMVDLEAVILASEEEIAAQEDSEEEVAAALQAEMVASEVATADLEAVILASEEEMAVREDSEEEVAAALQAEMVVSEMATVVLEAEDHPASEEEASTLRVPYSEAIAASQTPNLSEEEASVEEVEDHSVREAVVLEMRTVRSTAEMKKVPDEVEASEDEELQEVVVVLTLVSEAPKVDSEALRGAVDSVTTDLTRSPTLTTTLAILVQAKIEDLDQSGMMADPLEVLVLEIVASVMEIRVASAVVATADLVVEAALASSLADSVTETALAVVTTASDTEGTVTGENVHRDASTASRKAIVPANVQCQGIMRAITVVLPTIFLASAQILRNREGLKAKVKCRRSRRRRSFLKMKTLKCCSKITSSKGKCSRSCSKLR